MKLKARHMGILALITAAVCALGIFLFSLEDGAVSGGRSGHIMALLGRLLGEWSPNSEIILRKVAHFSEYALLAAILTVALLCFGRRVRRDFPWVLLPCLLCAVVDETIQRFVPGRGSSTIDVLIDFAGAVAGLLLVALIAHIIWRAKRKRPF